MIEAEGRVVLEEGRLAVEIMRSEACAKCGACQHGRTQRRLYPLPEGDLKVGDTVSVSLPEHNAVAASLLAYGVPLGGMLVGLAAGAALGLADIGQAGAALAGVAAGYLGLKAFEPVLKRSGRFKPKLPCAKKE